MSPLLEQLADMVADRVVARLGDALTPPSQTERAESLLDVHQAATHLGLARSTVYKLASSGKLPRVKLGNRLLFRRDDLDAHVLEHRMSREKIVELARKTRR